LRGGFGIQSYPAIAVRRDDSSAQFLGPAFSGISKTKTHYSNKKTGVGFGRILLVLPNVVVPVTSFLEAIMSLQYKLKSVEALDVRDVFETDFLDEVMVLFQKGHLEMGMDILGSNLYHLYTTTSVTEWENLVDEVLLNHPIKDLLMQDPLTERSFTQPRGYAGDSKLLDMVYSPNKYDLSNTSEVGKRLFKYTTRTSLSRTLRRRMQLIAEYIDKFAKEVPNASVLSVASGHCREADYSTALKSNALKRFIALDHDPKSLETMQTHYSQFGLEPYELNVKDLIKGSHNLGQFDLIYSAGLYDYLSTRFAQKLTQCLYDMLKPGGKLLLINIAAQYDEVGYLESYMNWSMIGRDKLDTMELAATVQSNEKAVIQVKEVEAINSHYQILELQKT
jgi:extracellular factor (EF) 3-hydroxypalmitic acid methyl ester biosynthesis protein